jgi:ABC-type transport system involved in multi-copper enzyme maturation permease subunit
VTGLLRAEALRFASRRLFRVIGLAIVGAILAAAVITFLESSKDPVQGFDDRFVYLEMIDATRSVAMGLFVLGYVVAASFVGAEWGTGTIATLLTWQPRRGRVLAAKSIVGAAWIAAAVVILLAFLAVVFLPVAAFRGTTDGLDGSTWSTLAGIWGRAAGVGAFAAFLGCSIATITRSTAGAIGVFFGYIVIVENILGTIASGRFQPWLLVHLLSNALGARALLQADAINPGVLLPIYGVAVIAAGWETFRRRDVT